MLWNALFLWWGLCRVVAAGLGLAVFAIACFVAVCFESRLNTGRIRKRISRFGVYDVTGTMTSPPRPLPPGSARQRGCMLWAFGRLVGFYMTVFYILATVSVYQVS